MATYGRLIREKEAEAARSARLAAAFRRDFGTFSPVGEIWKKQSAKAAFFPTHGWIPISLLRWRRADGTTVPFDCGYNGDTLVAPDWKLREAA